MAITIDGDNGISGVNGTATTPALQGTDSNTGIVFGTDEVQIATGGSTRATVDSSGNLGLGGITSPTWASDGGIHLGDDYGIGFGDGGSGRPDFQIITAGEGRLDIRCGFGSDDADIRIDSSGNFGIGGSPTNASDHKSLALFGAASNGAGFIEFNDTSGNADAAIFADNGHLYIGADYDNTTASSSIRFRVDGSTERARIASNGEQQHFGTNATNLNIANSAGAGNTYEFLYCQHSSTGLANGTNSFRVATDGDVFNTNNSYGSLSDQRLKENIIDATSQWDDIKGLQVRKYNFREDTGHETHTQLGLIAQEVESVSPGLVETSVVREGETVLDADGNQLESIKSINYSVLYMKAVKALQEAQTRIETLESQHADLLARVTALEAA